MLSCNGKAVDGAFSEWDAVYSLCGCRGGPYVHEPDDLCSVMPASVVARKQMKLQEREYGVLAFVDDDGRIWAQCAKPSTNPADTDYVIEGPLSGFVNEEGTFTTESEQEFRTWLDDRLIGEDLFYVKDKETALSFAQRIAMAACQILKDRPR